MEKRQKHGGRAKGTPNKNSAHLAHLLNQRDFDAIKEFVDIYREGELDDSERMKAVLKVFDFIYPKRKPVDSEGDSNDTIIVQKLEDYLMERRNGDKDAQDENQGT